MFVFLPLTVCCLTVVSEVVQSLQLFSDRDQTDVVGDLSVCLDGMAVDPETFASAEADRQSESWWSHKNWSSVLVKYSCWNI